MSKWPKDNQSALIAFYGDPGSRGFGAHLVKVVPPFAMYYAGKRVPHLSFHRLAAPSLLRALNSIWGYYGRDQARIDALRISTFSGTYNPRKVRGSATKWSNHAYGAAIDLDAQHNSFNSGHGRMPLPVVAAFKAEGFAWGGDYQHRTDPMHFELCDRGELARTFDEWLAHYKCPPRHVSAPAARAAPLLAEPEAPAGADDDASPAEPAEQEADDATDDSTEDATPLEGAVINETPAGAPKTGISEGAQAAGALTITGIASQVWEGVSKAPDSIMQALIHATEKPAFWVFAAIGCAATYIWWQRHAVKKGV